MDEKQKMIKELERIVVSLQHHLEKYNEYRVKSVNGRLKKDRIRASDDMHTHAGYIQQELTSHYAYPIISNGPYTNIQFEDFSKYAGKDTPAYITKIKEHLEKLKNEE
jgi:hypothetical protein